MRNIKERLSKDLARDPGILILAYPYARSWHPASAESVSAAWVSTSATEEGAVYIHVPFCEKKCTYCDFLAYYGRPDSELSRYVDLLVREIRIAARMSAHIPIKAISWGGGTPSLLSGMQIERVLDEIKKCFVVSTSPEITMEVYPDSTINASLIQDWKVAGVSRLSVGVQHFPDSDHRVLNRGITEREIIETLDSIRDVGFKDFNIDLMCGLPEQTEASWIRTCQRTLQFEPSHICVFPVSIRHPGIALFKKNESNPEFQTTRRMYRTAVEIFANSDYEQTTRHNFRSPGFDFIYERMMAEQSPILSIGAHGIGYAQDCIYKNHSHLGKYADCIASEEIPVHSAHFFSGDERRNNFAVRRIEHLRIAGNEFYDRFGLHLSEAFESEIAMLQENGLVELQGDDLVLTEAGIYFTSAVKRTFFHRSAWERVDAMQPESFLIERGNFELH